MIALVGSVTSALTSTLNRSLREVNSNIVVFYHSIMGITLAGTYILIEFFITGESRLTEYSARLFLMASGVGVLDVSALYCFTIAFMSDSSGFISLLTYLRIVIAYTIDNVFFDETFKTS